MVNRSVTPDVYCGGNPWIKTCPDQGSRSGRKVKNEITRSKTRLGLATLATAGCTGAALATKPHKSWVFFAGMGAISATHMVTQVYSYIDDLKSRFGNPCSSAFDKFKFKRDKTCLKLPRLPPLHFYFNEPMQADDPNDPALRNFLYTNVPWDDHCNCDQTLEN